MTDILNRLMSADQLKSIRNRLGMTQDDLAVSLGWNRRSGGRWVRRFEQGESIIPPHIADKIRNLSQEEA